MLNQRFATFRFQSFNQNRNVKLKALLNDVLAKRPAALGAMSANSKLQFHPGVIA